MSYRSTLVELRDDADEAVDKAVKKLSELLAYDQDRLDSEWEADYQKTLRRSLMSLLEIRHDL